MLELGRFGKIYTTKIYMNNMTQRIHIIFKSNIYEIHESGELHTYTKECVNELKAKNKRLEEWIDPIEEFKETDKEIIIHNGRNEYIYLKSEIDRYEFQEIEES